MALALAVSIALLAGCDRTGGKPTQTVAKVNIQEFVRSTCADSSTAPVETYTFIYATSIEGWKVTIS